MLTPSALVPGRSLSELAAFDRIANDVAFQAKIRTAIGAASPPLAKAKVDEKLARLDDEVGAIEHELRRREISRRRDEADAELAHLGGGKAA
jgi:hypothetical protein